MGAVYTANKIHNTPYYNKLDVLSVNHIINSR